MTRKTKGFLIAAVVLIIIGAVTFFVSMTKLNFDYSALSTEDMETQTYELENDFSNIEIKTLTSSVILLPAEDGKGRIERTAPKNLSCSVETKNGLLKVNERENRKWFEFIGIFTGSSTITVYLPKEAYNDLIITSDTGKITLTKIQCNSFSAETDTGKVVLTDFTASMHIDIETDTGDVILERADGNTLNIETDTGNVKGSLLSEKEFITHTDTGRINVPKTTSGGKCEISTDTGNIDITIE